MSIYEQIFKEHGLSVTQQTIIDFVGQNKVILEVGSSTGYMTNFFLKNNCIVDVVETNTNAIAKLPKGIRTILNQSIEGQASKKLLKKDYDFIIMADVLEHLVNPAKTLRILHQIASQKCMLMVSLPNIASWVMRKKLFFKGDFEYQESGLLDQTHLHFYTVNSLPKFLLENSWKVEKVVGTISRLPFEDMVSKIPIIGWPIRKIFYKYLTDKFKNLAYYHFLVVARKK